MLSHWKNSVDMERGQLWSQVSVCAHTLQHLKQAFYKSKEMCVYPVRLPQQLHQQLSPGPIMRFELPTSPKPEMRNDDIKNDGKI